MSELTLRNALAALSQWPDLATGVEEYAPSAYMLPVWPGSGALARALSARLPGMWYYSARGVTWQCGRRTARLVPYRAMVDAQECWPVMSALGLERQATVGSCARSLVRWAEQACPAGRADGMLLSGTEQPYQACEPGLYSELHYHDLSSAYYALLARMPSWSVTPCLGALVWHPDTPDARARRLDLLQALASCKALQRALYGVLRGSNMPGHVYHAGELRTAPARPGPGRAAAYLAYRTCWEATALAALGEHATYANTDCVMTPSPVAPLAWRALGLTSAVKASGAAHLVRSSVVALWAVPLVGGKGSADPTM